MSARNATFAAALALAVAAAPRAGADARERALADRGIVIEWIEMLPRREVRAIGDLPSPEPGTEMRFVGHLRNIASDAKPLGRVEWHVDGAEMHVETVAKSIPAQTRLTVEARWTAKAGRHTVRLALPLHEEWVSFETDAQRIRACIERRTLEALERDVGSLPRRIQGSLNTLHRSFEAARYPVVAPEGVHERFRLDDVVIYDRAPGADAPPGFESHPDVDVLVAYDEGGPIAGYSLPAYSIGHNFKSGDKGLLSAPGENALFHELGHFRGVPDLYSMAVAPGAVRLKGPGGKPLLEDVGLPDDLARCVMNSHFQVLRWSEYAAAVLERKRGVARVGACEETDHPFGHMWRDLPKIVRLQLLDEKHHPLALANVRVYRSRPLKNPPEGFRGQGVEADAAPVQEGVTRANGTIDVAGDYLGQAGPRDQRSLWLLVVSEAAGKTRASVILGATLNQRFWRGEASIASLEL